MLNKGFLKLHIWDYKSCVYSVYGVILTQTEWNSIQTSKSVHELLCTCFGNKRRGNWIAQIFFYKNRFYKHEIIHPSLYISEICTRNLSKLIWWLILIVFSQSWLTINLALKNKKYNLKSRQTERVAVRGKKVN